MGLADCPLTRGVAPSTTEAPAPEPANAADGATAATATGGDATGTATAADAVPRRGKGGGSTVPGTTAGKQNAKVAHLMQ